MYNFNPFISLISKYRRVYKSLKYIKTNNIPEILLVFSRAGIGDALLLTGIAKEFALRGRQGIAIVASNNAPHPELYYNNDDISYVIDEDSYSPFVYSRKGINIIYANYHNLEDGHDDKFNPVNSHILEIMMAKSGITGTVSLRPYIYLTDEEKEYGKFSDKQITIQVSSTSANVKKNNKEWYISRFQYIVDKYQDKYQFIQIGTTNDDKLDNVIDLRGKTSLRQSASILNNSLIFIGLEGFLMHLARAVDTRSVIILGGRTRPQDTGYICNENLYTQLPCAPCFRWNTCERERNKECMDLISVEMVMSAIDKQLEKYNVPLEVESVIIPNDWIQKNYEYMKIGFPKYINPQLSDRIKK